MKKLRVILIPALMLLIGHPALAQRHEVALTYGFGLAHFSESDSTIANQPTANRSSDTNGVFAFGFGLDVRVVSILSIRGEVRDFYADLPPLERPRVARPPAQCAHFCGHCATILNPVTS